MILTEEMGRPFVIDDESDEEYIGRIKKHKEEWDRELSNAMMAYCLGLLVPVVRCKDCKWWDTNGYGAEFDSEGYGWCEKIAEFDTKEDWYCGWGERKEEEDGKQ